MTLCGPKIFRGVLAGAVTSQFGRRECEIETTSSGGPDDHDGRLDFSQEQSHSMHLE